jgi:hypothetical protein
MNFRDRGVHSLLALAAVAVLASGCGGSGGGGGGGGSSPGAQSYSIGGSVSGLSGGVVLQNNSGDNLTVSSDGTFTFANKLGDAAAYNVTVLTAPSGQTCTVANGSGKVAGANVTNVTVTCANAVTSITGGTQAAADALSQAANNNVATVVAANSAQIVPTSPTSPTSPAGAYISDLPMGATTVQTYSCSQFASGGTGTISMAVISDANGYPASASFTYSKCTFSVSGQTVSLDGTANAIFHFVSSTNFSFDVTYNLSYVYSGTYSSSGHLNSSASCTYSHPTLSCSYNVGRSSVSNASVSISGTKTTVTSATVNTDRTTASNNLKIEYSNWLYDSSLGRATSGTVTITDANGNTAVITAGASSYSVTITYNKSTYHYTVTFG